jgi:hypothetical protein
MRRASARSISLLYEKKGHEVGFLTDSLPKSSRPGYSRRDITLRVAAQNQTASQHVVQRLPPDILATVIPLSWRKADEIGGDTVRPRQEFSGALRSACNIGINFL